MLLSQNKNFSKLWIAQSISLIGDQIFLLALPLMVYSINNSGAEMAKTYAFGMLPFLVFSFIGGSLSDQFSKKSILLYGNLISAIPLFVLLYLKYLNIVVPSHIYLLNFILSGVAALIMPAWEACIPSVVKRENLVEANSLTEVSVTGSQLLGPGLSGFLIGTLGAELAIILNAVSFIVSGIVVYKIEFFTHDSVSKPQKTSFKIQIVGMFKNILSGIKYVPKHKILRWGVFLSTFGNLILGAYGALLIFNMRDQLKMSPQAIGVFTSVTTVVPIVFSVFISKKLSLLMSRGKLMILGSIFQGLGVCLVGLSQNIYFLVLSQSLYLVAITNFQINWKSLRQEITPHHLMGRVSGACRAIAYTGASFGAFFSSSLIDKYSVQFLFVGQGLCIVTVAIVVGIWSPLRLKLLDTI